MTKISKRILISEIQNKTGCSFNSARFQYELLLDIIREHLLKGDDVILTGFGQFTVSIHRGHKTNFHDGSSVGDYKTLKFYPSNVIKRKLNPKMVVVKKSKKEVDFHE